MSVPKLKVTILRDNDAVQKAWLEVKDHGCDLRLYSQQYGTTVDWETVKKWEFGWENVVFEDEPLADFDESNCQWGE